MFWLFNRRDVTCNVIITIKPAVVYKVHANAINKNIKNAHFQLETGDFIIWRPVKSKLKKEADAFKTQTKKPDVDSGGSNAFLFFLNLLSAFLLAIVINTQRGALKKITNAITNENVLKLLQREEKKGITGYHLLLYISYFINAAIFVYLIVFNFFELQGWKYFQWIFLIILAIYLARHLFLTIIGRIFPFKKTAASKIKADKKAVIKTTTWNVLPDKANASF